MKTGRTFLFLFLFFLSINSEWYLIGNKQTSWINFLINKKTSKKNVYCLTRFLISCVH